MIKSSQVYSVMEPLRRLHLSHAGQAWISKDLIRSDPSRVDDNGVLDGVPLTGGDAVRDQVKVKSSQVRIRISFMSVRTLRR